MPESLRVRLLWWYAAILALVVAAVGAAVCLVTWRSRLATIDAELLTRAEAVARSVEPSGGDAFDVELPAELTAYFQNAGQRPYYGVWTAEGRLIARSDPDLSAGPQERRAVTRGTTRETGIAVNGLVVRVGRDISEVIAELWSLAGTIVMAALVGAAASLAGAWFLAGRALSPITRINETAKRMADGDLAARVAVERTDTELGQVAEALNLAFDRLRESVDRQRRFTADASHELRTPVTTIMAELEWALLRDRPSADYRESLETCHRAGTRMQSMVEALLTLARADSGQLPVRRGLVRLDALADDVIDALRPVARQRAVTLGSKATPLLVAGDKDRLRDLISNLLFNAISYNVTNGVVSLAIDREGSFVVLRVRNTGAPIPSKELPHVFDRFYRGEHAREREPGGVGLGLALAQWITSVHGGKISCTSDSTRGTEFVVRLPAVMAQQSVDDQTVVASGSSRTNE
jgi:heavy metal sensor kinase